MRLSRDIQSPVNLGESVRLAPLKQFDVFLEFIKICIKYMKLQEHRLPMLL